LNEAKPERRGHPALKPNKELAEQFGIDPNPDPPRELVKVEYIPVPPDSEHPEPPARRTEVVSATPEDRISTILAEEMDELGVRLARFGVAFTAPQKQDVVDYTMSRLMGFGGGGAIARR
jgi:hypothetical protein